jgi:hypothetical protein
VCVRVCVREKVKKRKEKMPAPGQFAKKLQVEARPRKDIWCEHANGASAHESLGCDQRMDDDGGNGSSSMIGNRGKVRGDGERADRYLLLVMIGVQELTETETGQLCSASW